MKNKAEVSIIVLTYNSVSKLKDFFDRVLASLFNICYSNFNIVFVDNNSQDETVDYLRKYINKVGPANNVKVLQLKKNHGWAGGNNRGAVICKDSDYLMFLNDDAVLESDTLNRLVDSLEADTSIGVAQPLIMNIDGTYYSGFDLGLGGFASAKIHRDIDNYQRITETFFAMGSALITRTNLFFKLGMFDEDYFYCYDDVDYCWRVRLAGFRVACVPNASVYHYESATLGKANPKNMYYWARNNFWVCAKNYAWRNLILTSPIRIVVLIGGLRPRLLSKSSSNAVFLIKGLLDGIRGLPLFLSKRPRVEALRKVRDAEIIRSMNPHVDIALLIGWPLRFLHHLYQKLHRESASSSLN